ncbi:MAG: MATE family efflux transporter [Saccharospirillum sp.]|uniref:MATE family efflux transporter n=1 Tax=Saccharospirillum sp. TaxID=2033801 RepID=UPI0032970C44
MSPPSETSASADASRRFIEHPLGPLFAQTALPIIFVMGMNGLLTVVDALFLGIFVGADALSAVTLMFPAFMLLVAVSTLVSNGMSSLLARHLGARRTDDARVVFAAAHGLAMVVSIVLIVLFLMFGDRFTLAAANGNRALAEMGYAYMRITIFCSPLLFVLALQSDALRNEGRVGFMAAMSLLVSLANMGFNYVLIALLEWGVSGSAFGTALAQCLALTIVLGFRSRGDTDLRLLGPAWHPRAWGGVRKRWVEILTLGAPQSLSFLGLALGSGAIILALQLVQSDTYAETVSAYGIATRLMTFAFLPLLGLSFALQSITGNNYGAGLWHRSDGSLRLGLLLALLYCLLAEITLIVFARPIGGWFVDDPIVVDEVGRIMPMIVSMFFVAGPILMIATYFQAIGDAGRAALLSLTKTYLFAIPLTFLLPVFLGETGIWLAGPTAELLLLLLTWMVLNITARQHGHAWGLFKTGSAEASV